MAAYLVLARLTKTLHDLRPRCSLVVAASVSVAVWFPFIGNEVVSPRRSASWVLSRASLAVCAVVSVTTTPYLQKSHSQHWGKKPRHCVNGYVFPEVCACERNSANQTRAVAGVLVTIER